MRTTLACFVLSLLVACSGSDGPTDPGAGNENPPPGGSNGGNQSAPSTRTVTLTATSFSPVDATVAVGGTVTWENESAIAHTITPQDHSQWSRVQTSDSGEVLEVTFSTAGTYNYLCELHAGMSGQIRVQ